MSSQLRASLYVFVPVYMTTKRTMKSSDFRVLAIGVTV